MTTGKTIALTRQAFVGKVTSLFFNMLSRFVIAFPPRSKHLLMSWLQSPSEVTFSSVQFSSVAQSCPTLCDPMNRSVGEDKLDTILKSRDTTLPTKVHVVKAMIFPVVIYECESWTIKKAEHQRIAAFKFWSWRRLLTVPWTARRSNQSILKEIKPKYSLEGLILKLKLQNLAT